MIDAALRLDAEITETTLGGARRFFTVAFPDGAAYITVLESGEPRPSARRILDTIAAGRAADLATRPSERAG